MLSTALMRAVTEMNLGSALQADGRLDEAVDHYHRAIAFAPDFPPAYNNLATALRAKGQVADAIATYQQALRVRPEYPEAEYNLANALLDAGKPAEAIEHFQHRAADDPGVGRRPQQPRDRADGSGQARRGDRRVPRGAGGGARSRRNRTSTWPTRSARRTCTPRRSSTSVAPSQLNPADAVVTLRSRQPAAGGGSARRGDRRVPRGVERSTRSRPAR